MDRHGQPRKQGVKQGVWVSYQYGFSADIGGGEYTRPLTQPSGYQLYLVGEGGTFASIKEALNRWRSDQPEHAVVELTDSDVYVEQINIALRARQSLQLRAGNRRRPVLRLLDWQTSLPDSLGVSGEPGAGAWFTLDGVMITGRGVQVEGDVSAVVIRHSTLVPGWGLHCDCEPKRPTEPSLALFDVPGCLTIEPSIVGAIQITRDEVEQDPLLIRVSDSILGAPFWFDILKRIITIRSAGRVPEQRSSPPGWTVQAVPAIRR